MAEQNQRTWPPPDRKKFWQEGLEFWQDRLVGPPLKMTQVRLWQCRLNNADNYQDSVEHLIVIQTDIQHRLRLEWSRYMVIQLLEAKGSFWKHNYTIEITNIIAPLIQSRWVLHQIVCCVLHFDLLKFWDIHKIFSHLQTLEQDTPHAL